VDAGSLSSVRLSRVSPACSAFYLTGVCWRDRVLSALSYVFTPPRAHSFVVCDGVWWYVVVCDGTWWYVVCFNSLYVE
jgi:hypothetical protein